MQTYDVQCSKNMTDLENAWLHIREFGSSWHPHIKKNELNFDATGAVVRIFSDTQGNVYNEQLTYFSDSDRKLRYALTEGIKDVEKYRAEVAVSSNTVSWSARFDAVESMGQAVADGTRAIFNDGLEWLEEHKPTAPTTAPSLSNTNAKIHPIQISNAAHLSVQSTIRKPSSCWTLVLFIHGIGGNATNWETQLTALANSYNVAALDLRGYGNSKLGDLQTRIEDHCDDILKVMQHFGARKLVLVGLSMGSWIATSFAMRHPQLLSGLVLSGGCTGMSEADADERSRFLQSRAVPLSEGKSPADFADAVVQLVSGPQATKLQRSKLHESMSAISSETYLDALTCFSNPIERFDFSRIACPVLLMTGEKDQLAPPEEIREVSWRIYDAIEQIERLPDIRFEVIDGAGHLCNLERPDLFNEQLFIFLKRMPGTTQKSTLTRETKRQLKSRRILDAALQEFSALGFDGASMSAIAKSAGVSKPTLYQYFNDKDSLLKTVLQEGCDHIMTPLSAPHGTLVDRLWEFSWTYADFVLRPDILSLARLVLGEASRRPEVAISYHRAGPSSAFKGLVAFIQECVNANQLDVDNLENAAQDLWSLILSGPRDYHLHFVNKKPDPDQLLQSIGHGLNVFLKIYSMNREADLEALAKKINELQTVTTGILGRIEK